jgi:FPC/CPF motif-containing protein YcgG
VSRAAKRERVDGLVMMFPPAHGESVEALAVLTNRILRGLTSRDGLPQPFGNPARAHWQFIHHGERYYVLAFGSCYPRTHSRHSFGSPHAMLMFQPQASFRRAAGRNARIPAAVRCRIRDRYAEAGQPYDDTHVGSAAVAESFVLPLSGASTVKWWVAK